MDLYEHQARELFEEHGILVPRAEVTDSPKEAREIARRLGGRVVVKAQVKTGGRGKAGGVKLAADPAAAELTARQILGMDIKGHTVAQGDAGPTGRHRERVLRLLRPRPRRGPLPRHRLRRGRHGDRGGRRDPAGGRGAHPHRPGRGRHLGEGGARSPRPPGCPPQTVDVLVSALGGADPRGRPARRGQPARPHRRRADPRPRRQGHPRRQRPLPAGPLGRRQRRPPHDDPAGGGGRRQGPQLRQARRRGRHHRQRRGPGHVHPRRGRRLRRAPRQLPRHRRRRLRPDHGRRALRHPLRPGREVRLRQRLRRHHRLRRGRRRHRPGPGHPSS